MNQYINMCGVFGCYTIYTPEHQHTECPDCGISRADIIAHGTNDRDIINSKKIDKELDDLYNDALGG